MCMLCVYALKRISRKTAMVGYAGDPSDADASLYWLIACVLRVVV